MSDLISSKIDIRKNKTRKIRGKKNQKGEDFLTLDGVVGENWRKIRCAADGGSAVGRCSRNAALKVCGDA